MVETRYLLATNVLCEPLRPWPDQGLVQQIREHEDHITVPAPVWHELLHGCYRLPKSKRRDAIEAYLFETIRPSFPILAYDEKAAEWHARERARLTAKGLTPPYIDGQIAAIAAVNALTLITSNSKDFDNFKDLEVRSWRSES
jgi:tRNA(fMet)-specific endonuclease VapC